jgi:alginate O-acetyltransferase complex protein AlgI
MLPTTPEYYCFLALVFLAFWLVRRNRLACILLISAANLFFYAKAGLIYLMLIPAASACDFWLGRAMAATSGQRLRQLLVSLSIVMNVGLIAGARGFLLPVSLSFYAFQALTYTLDIYRKDAKPAASYWQYFASVSFFPTALAGPITRVSSLMPQWNWKGAVLSGEDGSRALFLIGLGLAKKFLIADYLGNHLVNRVFDLPTLYSGGDVTVAVYAYAFQLYYDFSGYSDIAIGAGLLLGIRLPANFNAPYIAQNLADFWKRWHISFSKWLQEYLYFSLPGPRTRVMPYLNLVITMAIGGIWHGTGWTFLIWGLIHGAGLAVFRLWQSMRKNAAPTKSALGSFGAGLLTFHFVLLGWIFFRAANVDTAMKILGQIATLQFSLNNATPAFLGVLAIAIAGHFIPKSWFEGGLTWFSRSPAVLQSAAMAGLVFAIQKIGAGSPSPFIYSKF